jgi:secreted PhoX family phosphatase
MELSRRHFLKGAAASAVGVATGSVLEAYPGNAETTESPTGTESTNPTWLGEAPVISDDQIVDTIRADIIGIENGHWQCYPDCR